MATTLDNNLVPIQEAQSAIIFAVDHAQMKADQAAARRATDHAEQVKVSEPDG
jgi:hypothetical protein